MVSVFYVAAIIAILASFKVISSTVPFSALLYLTISLLASAVIFLSLDAYLSAVLEVIMFVGAVAILFLSVASFLDLRKDFSIQEKRGLTAKIWLGPLILAFVLLVILLYSIAHTDYSQIAITHGAPEPVSMSDKLLGPYILVVELAALLLLGALIVAYHFAYEVYLANESSESEDEEQELNIEPRNALMEDKP